MSFEKQSFKVCLPRKTRTVVDTVALIVSRSLLTRVFQRVSESMEVPVK